MQWREIPGFSNYEVSEIGLVRRHIDKVHKKVGRRKKPGELLAVSVRDYNRKEYTIWNDLGNSCTVDAGALVCLAFNGPKPSSKHVVAHGDGDASNNIPNNVRWATKRENDDDTIRHGSHKGERDANSKLTRTNVIWLRNEVRKGRPISVLARELGVGYKCAWKASKGETWGHISNPIPKEGGYNWGGFVK